MCDFDTQWIHTVHEFLVFVYDVLKFYLHSIFKEGLTPSKHSRFEEIRQWWIYEGMGEGSEPPPTQLVKFKDFLLMTYMM